MVTEQVMNDAGLAAFRQYVQAVSGDKTVTVEY